MGSVFGGDTGLTRLVDASLGGQAGWLLGMALAGGLAVAVLTRLRRADARTGWIIAAGGAFLTTAIAFSYAKGIFHPYYVSMLAPFTAVLVGATAGTVAQGAASRRGSSRRSRSSAGSITEVMVIHRGAADVEGLVPLVIVAGLGGAAVLAAQVPAKVRGIALAVALGALLIAPATLGRRRRSAMRRAARSRPAGRRRRAWAAGRAAAGRAAGGGSGGRGGFGGGGGAPAQLPGGTGTARPRGQAAPPAGFALGGGGNATNNAQGAAARARRRRAAAGCSAATPTSPRRWPTPRPTAAAPSASPASRARRTRSSSPAPTSPRSAASRAARARSQRRGSPRPSRTAASATC